MRPPDRNTFQTVIYCPRSSPPSREQVNIQWEGNMKNEATEIAEATDELKRATAELKEKARMAGVAAWDLGKATYQGVQDKAVACTKATDQAIRSRPYAALGIAFGAGVLLGALVLRAKSKNDIWA